MLLVPTKVNLDQLVDAWHLSFNSHISTFVCARWQFYLQEFRVICYIVYYWLPRSNLNLARVNACDMFSKLCILFVVCIRVSVFDNILRTEMLSRSDQAVVDCIIFSQGHLVCRPNVSVIICTLICIVSCLSSVWDSYLIHWLYRLNC